MQKELYNIKNTEENKKLVQLIESELIDLKNEIEEISENEIKIEKPYEIVHIVAKFLTLIIKTKKENNLKY